MDWLNCLENQNNMAKVNIRLGDQVIATSKPHSLVVDKESKIVVTKPNGEWFESYGSFQGISDLIYPKDAIEMELEYYMRRGNKMYFRNPKTGLKISADLDGPMTEEMSKNIRYGMKVNSKFTIGK